MRTPVSKMLSWRTVWDIGNLTAWSGIFPRPYGLKACLDFHIATMSRSIYINVIKMFRWRTYNSPCHMFPRDLCSIVSYILPRVLCSLMFYVPSCSMFPCVLCSIVFYVPSGAMFPRVLCSPQYLAISGYLTISGFGIACVGQNVVYNQQYYRRD